MTRNAPRAQSEPLGVVLLTAVVVVSVSVAGVVALADAGGDETTRASLDVTVTREGVGVAHDGGASVPLDDLRVVVRNDGVGWRPTVSESDVLGGDGDAELDPGERLVVRRPLGESLTTVHVVDARTGTLLAEVEAYPTRLTSLPGTPTATPTPTAPSPTATLTASPTAPTATGTPDSPTATQTSTATPAATPSPTATPTATPAPDRTDPSVDAVRVASDDSKTRGRDRRTSSMAAFTVDWRVSDDRAVDEVAVRLVRVDGFFRFGPVDGESASVTGTSAAGTTDLRERGFSDARYYFVVVTVTDEAGNADSRTILARAG